MKTIKRRWGLRTVGIILILTALGYIAWTLLRPLPTLAPQPTTLQIQKKSAASTLVWPETGQSAVGVMDSNILETHGPQSALPIASTAKIITALVVLRNKPLQVGQQGPAITLSANDVALYETYSARQGSVVPVRVGEQISEYQMLQAILLPSANNMADSLAIWAYGSLDAYSTAANSYLKDLELHTTHVGSDASGFSPTTTSTAHDLVRLGELAMQNPVVAQIVGQTSATGVPLTDSVKNVNFLLGSDNIIGIKTGNTEEAGGVFISASRILVNNKPVTIVTALAGAPSLFAALKYSVPLIQSAQTNFQPVTLVKADTIVGSYSQPWGGTLSVVAGKDLTTNAWNGSTVSATGRLQQIMAYNTKNGQSIGTITTPDTPFAPQQSVHITLYKAPKTPSVWWRLAHPVQ